MFANSVDHLEKVISNFVEFRSELVPGGCPLVNTAVEADDGNAALRARARQALQSWMGLLSKIAADGITENQIDRRIAPRRLSQLIIGTLEGALLTSRLQKRSPSCSRRSPAPRRLPRSKCPRKYQSQVALHLVTLATRAAGAGRPGLSLIPHA